MSKQTKLIGVPTFTYNQGDIFMGDSICERPISIDYYNDNIVLRQDGEYDVQEEIIISSEHLAGLIKAIKANLKDAEMLLKMRNKQQNQNL